MSAKDATMSAKDATMSAKDATMSAKDATMSAKGRNHERQGPFPPGLVSPHERQGPLCLLKGRCSQICRAAPGLVSPP